MTKINTPKGEPFFFYFSVIILIIVVGGFGINGIVNFETVSISAPVVYVHTMAMLTWYSLVVLQTKLIRQGNQGTHMKLGKLSIILAVVIVISGIIITLYNYARTSSVNIVAANLFFMVNFITLYTLALIRRRYSDKHKRLMLLASLAMVLPALSRITHAVDINGFYSIPMWLILILIPIGYDIKTLRKVHKTTIFGTVLLIVGLALTITLISSPSWAQFLESTIGRE